MSGTRIRAPPFTADSPRSPRLETPCPLRVLTRRRLPVPRPVGTATIGRRPVDFGILGALQLVRDGEPVPLPGRILPRLLAILLLETGHVVPLPKLVEALWDDAPPGTARRQIQNTAATVRGLLHGDTAELETFGAGYRLRARPEQVDALRFQAGVRLAREKIAASEPETALHRLREALGRWRGPALVGLPGRLIESGARLLNEERAAAEEDRAELELALRTGAPSSPTCAACSRDTPTGSAPPNCS